MKHINAESFLKIAAVALLCLTLFSSCNQLRRWFGNEPERLAQIDKNILYRKDVESLIPGKLSAVDSVNAANHYIDLWAIDNLLLRKAEQELSGDEKNVDQELADYRKSLLVFRYQKKYVEERIDTVISGEEAAAYYEANKALFILDDPLCKARFIKMGRQSPYLPIIKTIYRSNGMEDVAQLERLCESSAEVYKTYSNAWIGVSELAQDLPLGKDEVRNALRPDGYIETTDSLYTYLVSVYEFIPAGHPAPLEYKESNIKQIILSKRKQSLLKDLETEVLKEGWSRQMIKIYNKNED